MKGIRVTAEDLETGDKSSIQLEPGNYVVVCAEPCYLAHEQHFATGTTTITLKGRNRDLMGTKEVQ